MNDDTTSDPLSEPVDLGRMRQDQMLREMVEKAKVAFGSGDSKAMEELFANLGGLMKPAMNRAIEEVTRRDLSPAEQQAVDALQSCTEALASTLAELGLRLRIPVAHIIASMSNVILEIRSGDARGHLLGDNYIAPMGR